MCLHVDLEAIPGGSRCKACGMFFRNFQPIEPPRRKPYAPPKLTPIDPGKGLACATCGHSSLVHSRALDSSPTRPRFPCAQCSACENFVLRAPPVE